MENSKALEDRIQQLSTELEEMRGRVAQLEGAEKKPSTTSTNRSNRRGFLRLGAGAALGAVGLAAGKVLPAAATNGDPITAGNAFNAEATTSITDDSGGGIPAVFTAVAKGFSSTALNAAGSFVGPLQGLGAQGGTDPLTAVNADGVDGWAEGVKAFGVYGLTDAGVGVTGESNTGIGLWARRSGRILQDPRPGLAGKPNYPANDVEMVRDANGGMWLSVPAAFSAVGWVQAAAMSIFSNPRRVFDGDVQPTVPTGSPGVQVDATTIVNTSGFPGGPSGVPAGARAAFCAVQSYSAGVMTLYPDGGTDPLLANWASTANGPLNLYYMFVPLSAAGKFRMRTYFTGRKYVDVWGFYF